MKFLAVLLIACIFLLSTFPGMVRAAAPAAKHDCCKHMANKACTKKPVKDDDCSKPGCTMLFACSMYGFLTVEPLRVKPAMAMQITKSVSLHQAGHLSAYATSNWKPPQTV